MSYQGERLLYTSRDLSPKDWALHEKGQKAEARVIEALKAFPTLVKKVVPTFYEQDKEGIDLWVHFTRQTQHFPKPIQVKSCFKDIRIFDTHPNNSKLVQDYGQIILINANPLLASDEDIRRAFLIQLQRIDGFIFPRKDQLTKPRISPNINLWQEKLAS